MARPPHQTFIVILPLLFLFFLPLTSANVTTPDTGAQTSFYAPLLLGVFALLLMVGGVRLGEQWVFMLGAALFFVLGVIILQGNLLLPAGEVAVVDNVTGATTTTPLYAPWTGSNNQLIGWVIAISAGLLFLLSFLGGSYDD